MKKVMMILFAVMMMVTMYGCGSTPDASEENPGSEESQYKDSLEVLNQVFDSYEEGDRFAVYGGNQENAVMDAPGMFDISKAEELEMVLGLPQDQSTNIEDAASMVHMMNGNTFTGAAYRLKDNVDVNAFADSVKACIQDKQWICGQPDTLIILQADDRYVITAYGEAGIIEIFKNNVLSSLNGAKVVTEAPIA